MNRYLFDAVTAGVFAVVLAATPLVANAHYLWVERNGGAAVLHFGEYEEGAMERSPGRLDEIRSPKAVAIIGGEEKVVDLNRQSSGFAFAAKNARDPLLVREVGYPVKDWTKQGIGLVKPMFYARNAASSASVPAVLPLDIVPAEKPGQFAVWFNGKPLPKASVKIIAPNGWVQEDKTNGEGKVDFPMPWRGQYILHVINKEEAAGDFEGAHYDAIRHRTTLTIQNATGPKTFVQRFAEHKD